MELLYKGGILMIPLLICSVLMLAVIGERLYFYHLTMAQPLKETKEPELIVANLRKGLPVLHTIISIAPMLGLLGTIGGLIKSFRLIGAAKQLASPAEMGVGIGEALITTAGGLIIAVVATIFYNFLTARLESYVAEYNLSLKEVAVGEAP